MSDEKLDEMVLSMIAATKKMDEEEYARCKYCLLAVVNWSEAIHNFMIEFFRMADKSRPMCIEMKGGAA